MKLVQLNSIIFFLILDNKQIRFSFNISLLELYSKIKGKKQTLALGVEILVLNWSLFSVFYIWVDKNKGFLL